MRQKRAKAYRKLMSLYCMSFGFRQPYQVLVDSEMCKTAISHKYELVKQMGVVLQGTVKPMITQCCIHELYLQGKSEQPSVDLAKTFERRKCNHREPIPGDECLADVVGETNKHRYVIATQSTELRDKLRLIPAVPVVHMNRSVMILEPPSDATMDAKEANEEKSMHASTSETKLGATAASSEPPRKKRKGPKGPNPLSVKKKKAEPLKQSKPHRTGESSASTTGAKRTSDRTTEEGHSEADSGHKRKRKRKRKTMEDVGEEDSE
ncbi:PIN domain-like protein [Cristinia sonorae]|uniref:U three protein 23 n=1 Tax=Cristinia sonorae TaxID=1940300 RepID=A0A8K0XS51_9AGAR|nr:PIN domain-like protein [Cristinia sonorae]